MYVRADRIGQLRTTVTLLNPFLPLSHLPLSSLPLFCISYLKAVSDVLRNRRNTI